MNNENLDADGLIKSAPHEMTTWSGKRFNPQAIRVEDIEIEDIAHALSRQCRYNGHVEGFMSVARHSIWVAEALPVHLRLAGLLHDAAEAYLGDLTRPLKHSPFGEAYIALEAEVEKVISERFGLPFPLPQEVKDADNKVLLTIEMIDHDSQQGARWDFRSTPEYDEHEFLSVFRELTEEPDTRLIGLVGYAQSGKDTVGMILHDLWGFHRNAFADTLRECLYAINPLIPSHDSSPPKRLQEVVDANGWDRAKVDYPEIRELLQRLGTEMGRDILGQDIWVDTAMNRLEVPGFNVFTDVRFPNEFDAIKAAGGEVWRIQRPGTGPVNDHPSETALDGHEFDWWIDNSTTIEDLCVTVQQALGLVVR